MPKMRIEDIVNETYPMLYHGTSEESAKSILKNGWSPNKWPVGANQGQRRFLYLSTMYDDALWFAEQKGCSVVIGVIDVPLVYLRVDPEDGIGNNVVEELNNTHGLPGKVVLIHPLGPEHFIIVDEDKV